MKIVKTLSLVLIANLITLVSAYAYNTGFVSDVPFYHSTKHDRELLRSATHEALERGSDGKKIEWHNPQSGSFGYVLPSHTQGACKDLTFFNNVKGMTNKTSYKFCKMDDKWKVMN